MPLIQINKEPSATELRWFGLLFALFFGLIGGLIGWRFAAWQVSWWMWGIGGGVAVLYYAVPPLRHWIYLGWVYAAFPLGWAISHLLLGMIYYGVVTPIGLVMRLFGYDPMQQKLDREASTYWISRENDTTPRRYFRQF